MQRWEYHVQVEDRWLANLDLLVLGRAGWELITVLQPDHNRMQFIFYFKRLMN